METTTRQEKLIFLVEDDMSVARLIATILRDYQFKCECFRTGSELFRRLRTATPIYALSTSVCQIWTAWKSCVSYGRKPAVA